MGRVRTAHVKRLAEELRELEKTQYTTSFDENKMKLEQRHLFATKLLRNKVAGYITRIVIKEQNKEKYLTLASAKKERQAEERSD